MKKAYMKPLTEVVDTLSIKAYLVSASGNGLNMSSGGGTSTGSVTKGDSKYRGDYEPEEEPNFGDLW